MKHLSTFKKKSFSMLCLLLTILLSFGCFNVFSANAGGGVIPEIPNGNTDYTASISVADSTVPLKNGMLESEQAANSANIFENVPFTKTDSYVFRANVRFTAAADSDAQSIRLIFRGNSVNDNICLIMLPNGVSIKRYFGGQFLNPRGAELFSDKFKRELNHNYDIAVYTTADGKTTVTIDGAVCFSDKNIGKWNALTGVNFQNIAAAVEPVALYRTTEEESYLIPEKPEGNTDFSAEPDISSDTLSVSDNEISSDLPQSGTAILKSVAIPKNVTYVSCSQVCFRQLSDDTAQQAVRLIYRGSDAENYLCLSISAGGITLNQVKYGALVNTESSPVSRRFKPESGKTYNFIIVSERDKVNVLIDGVRYFADVPVQTENVLTGARLVSAAASVKFTGIYNTSSDSEADPYAIPEKPENNYDYVDYMTLSGALSFEDKYFVSDTLAHEEWNLIKSSIGGNDSFVYKANVLVTDAKDAGSTAFLIFRGSSINDFLALSFSKNGATLIKRSGWNDIPVSGAATNADYGYKTGTECEVSILSEPGFVSVWIDGEIIFNKVAVDNKSAVAGMGFHAFTAGRVTPVSLYRTADEGNFPIPERPTGNYEYGTLCEPVIPADFTETDFSNGVLSVRDSGKTGFISIGGAKLTDNYVFRATVNVTSEPENDYQSPRIIFRKNNSNDYLCLAMFRNNLLLLHMRNGIAVMDFSGNTSVPFDRVPQKDFDVAIYTESGKVSVWVDGMMYFNSVGLPEGFDIGLTVISERINFTMRDFSVYNTSPENFPEIPSKPSGNIDFGGYLNVAISEKFVNTAFKDGVFHNGDSDKSATMGIGNVLIKSDFVFRTTLTVNSAVEHDYQSPRIIFRSNGNNDYLCLAFFDGSLLLLHMKNGVAVNDFGASAAMKRTVGKSYDIAIYSTDNAVSVWVNGLICFENIAVPTGFQAKLSLISELCDYSMYGFSVYNTNPENFMQIPQNTGIDYGKDMLLSIPCLAYATYKNHVLQTENTDSEQVITYASLDFSPSDSYVYRAKVKLDAETPSDSLCPELIFRMKDSRNFLSLSFFRGCILVLEMKNGKYCFDNFDGLNASFSREVGRTYDVAVLSEPESVSVWVDGLPVFESEEIPSGYDSKLGVRFKHCLASLSDMQVYKTVGVDSVKNVNGLPQSGENTARREVAATVLLASAILFFVTGGRLFFRRRRGSERIFRR